MTEDEILALIDDRPEDGVFRVSRRLFSDPAVFDLEMKYIFEASWVFLGLTSQAPNPNDYLTTRVGRHPVVVMRDGDGELNAFINSCPHKGAKLCHLVQGNRKLHVCPYHSWSFDSAGKLRGLKNRAHGEYSAAFDADSHDLLKLPRFAVYRGLMFGSMSADAPPLDDYLGDVRKLIDLAVDASPEGLELVPGAVGFTYAGNWKLQLENCSDQYHFSSTHPSYLRVIERRAANQWAGSTRTNWGGLGDQARLDPGFEGFDHIEGGSVSFDHGHVLNWNRRPVGDGHPLFESAERLKAEFGETKRDWMFFSRNLTLFPNVQLAENASSQLRIMRPIGPGMTEMLAYCMAPVGESAAARTQRIRQYEDFFNPSGLATPDDTVNYEDCQDGHSNPVSQWLQGHARGMMQVSPGGDPFLDAIDVHPATSLISGEELGDETIFHVYYRTWLAMIKEGLRKERSRAPAGSKIFA